MNSPSPEEVKAKREALGLTQTEAAELIHSTLRTWQNWEKPHGSKENRVMHPAFWELFLIKANAAKRQQADAYAEEYDPWIAGRMLSKYDIYQRWPTESELADWLEGFIAGCVDMAEYEIWRERLYEFTLDKNAPAFLSEKAKKPTFSTQF